MLMLKGRSSPGWHRDTPRVLGKSIGLGRRQGMTMGVDAMQEMKTA